MMEDKNSFYEKHKTEIIVAGVIVAVTIISITGAILITKNGGLFKRQNVTSLFKNGVKAKDSIIPPVSETIQNTVIDIPSNENIIEVSKHIRNLPEGWRASTEKAATAMQNGFDLVTNQTWVDDYSKLCA